MQYNNKYMYLKNYLMLTSFAFKQADCIVLKIRIENRLAIYLLTKIVV